MLDFNKLEQLNTEQLKRNNLGDNLNFNQVNSLIIKIKDKLLFFKNNNYSNILTSEDINEIYVFGDNFINLCNEVIGFQHNSGEALSAAINRRNSIITKFVNLKKQFNIAVLPLVHEAMLFDEETQKRLDNFNQTVAGVNKRYEENNNIFNQNINSYNQRLVGMENEFKVKVEQVEKIKQLAETEANSVRMALKDFSTEKLVGEYGEIFEKQAEINKKIAGISLFVLLVFGIVLIWYAQTYFTPLIELVLKFNNGINYGYLATNLIFRLTILSLFFIAIKESIKNFNVNMHLYNLNKHRQNALKSFNVFKGLPYDSETRDCLIKEIATTIYSVNKIGYLSENQKAIDFSQIIDLIKALKP